MLHVGMILGERAVTCRHDSGKRKGVILGERDVTCRHDSGGKSWEKILHVFWEKI